MVAIGFVIFVTAIILPFPLALTGTIAFVGFCIITSFTVIGFIIGSIGYRILLNTDNAKVSSLTKNIVKLKHESMDLPSTYSAAPNKTPVNTWAQAESKAFFKAQSALLAKYSDIANILNVRLTVRSLGFWKSQENSTPTIVVLLASELVRIGHKTYEINSRFAPLRTVAEEVAMALADLKNSEVKSEIIAELSKLDLPDFTKEKKDGLIDTLNDGEKLLRYCKEVSRSNADEFYEFIHQTRWSSTT
jgi:hypothetical protein